MRTKLLLAFGLHGNEFGIMRLPPQKRFFRDAVVPFLEKHVGRGKRDAVVIHELGSTKEWEDSFEENEKREAAGLSGDNKGMWLEIIRGELYEREVRYRGILEKSLDIGRAPDAATDGIRMEDWGFLDHIAESNRRQNGRITNLFEPPSAEAACERWRTGFIQDMLLDNPRRKDGPELALEFLKSKINFYVKRDNAVAASAERLALESPERAIVIPRGLAHAGMTALFDSAKFDITLSKDERFTTDFVPDAAKMAYEGRTDGRELERFAALQLEFFRASLDVTLGPLESVLYLAGAKLTALERMRRRRKLIAIERVGKGYSGG